jgi:SAM-dependent methyltransferase
MEFRLSGPAMQRELEAYLGWRDKYAREPERCRRYEPVRRHHPVKNVSGRLDERLVLRALGHPTPGGRVLDVPCGGGRISRALRAAGHRPVAVDYSPWMLTEASDASDERIRADVLRLPYRDGTFEATVCFRFMQSVPRELRIRTLAELARVGRLVVASYASVYSLRSLRRFLGGRPLPRNRLTEPQVRSEVDEAGLEIVGFRYKARLLYEDFVVVARRPT